MNEFFNWHNTSILMQHNWLWLAIAMAIGIWVGWRTCDTSTAAKR